MILFPSTPKGQQRPAFTSGHLPAAQVGPFHLHNQNSSKEQRTKVQQTHQLKIKVCLYYLLYSLLIYFIFFVPFLLISCSVFTTAN